MYIFKLILNREPQKRLHAAFDQLKALLQFMHLLPQYSPYNQLQIEL
jgi:hypothetical protein